VNSNQQKKHVMQRGISSFSRPLNFRRAPHLRSLPLQLLRFFLHGHAFPYVFHTFLLRNLLLLNH
jgi:hypothetical protein